MAGIDALWIDATPRSESDAADDDGALVAHALCDREAFSALYTRYSGRVFWYCYLRLGNRELAEDATSLTFAKAFASLADCRQDRFRPWLYSLARNVVTDVYRDRRDEASLDTAWNVADPAPSPEEIAIRREGHDTARTLLSNLSENQRQIVELRLAGLTGAEIARVLGRSHIWVRVNQLRAYNRLRCILESEGTHDEV